MPADDLNLDTSADDIIAEARRPILVDRHRTVMEEMEVGLSDALVTGESDHPRLKAMLAQLEAESERARTAATLRQIATDGHYRTATLRKALVEELCLLRERKGVEVAALQLHVIGVYREVRRLLAARQGEPPGLGDLRELPAPLIGRLLTPVAPQFGSPTLGECTVCTPGWADRCLRVARRIRKAENADLAWAEAAGDPALPREQEEPLEGLPEGERKTARLALVRERIRSQFYRDVFLEYFDPDQFEPKDAEAHATVLAWLEAVESTAHLYPFMQGQTSGQKAWRLGRLLEKVVQLHEVYARVALASQHPTYREAFQGRTTRERLAALARDHFPPLPLSNDLTLAALLCPFSVFVAWVQEKAAARDFVLPPDAKR